MSFGKRIRFYRKMEGLTQNDLADEIDVPQEIPNRIKKVLTRQRLWK